MNETGTYCQSTHSTTGTASRAKGGETSVFTATSPHRNKNNFARRVIQSTLGMRVRSTSQLASRRVLKKIETCKHFQGNTFWPDSSKKSIRGKRDGLLSRDKAGHSGKFCFSNRQSCGGRQSCQVRDAPVTR